MRSILLVTIGMVIATSQVKLFERVRKWLTEQVSTPSGDANSIVNHS